MQSLVCVLFAVVDFDNTDTSWRKYDTSKDEWMIRVQLISFGEFLFYM